MKTITIKHKLGGFTINYVYETETFTIIHYDSDAMGIDQ